MSREQEFFLLCLKDHFLKQETKDPGEMDWNELYRIADDQQFLAVVFCQCRAFLPKQYEQKYRKATNAIAYLNNTRREYTRHVTGLLQNAGIPYILVKGAVVSDYYPDWQFRSMGDTDIISPDLKAADEVMRSDGFERSSKNDYVCCYDKDDLHYELHSSLVDFVETYTEPVLRFLGRYLEYVRENRLDPSFHFLYVLVHLRKHLMNFGIGFRQFADVALFAANESGLDKAFILDELEKMGLLPFAKKVFFLTERWFGIPTMFDREEEQADDTFFAEATDWIFKNGVFGFQNEENRQATSANAVRGKKSHALATLGYAFKRVFQPYKTMVSTGRYPFLEGRPWLTPAAWVKRWIDSIKKRGLKSSGGLVGDAFVTKEYVAKREALYAKWGLNE